MKKWSKQSRLLMRLQAFLVCIGLCLLVGEAMAVVKYGSVASASDGKGNLRLIWLINARYWPTGGWRIEDDKGHVLVKQLKPAQAKQMNGLNKADKKQVMVLTKLPNVHNPRKRKQLVGLAEWHALTDWQFAQAAGLATELHWLAAGMRRYRIIGLDAKGRATKIKLLSKPVNSHVATPLPKSPRTLHAKQNEDTVELDWEPVGQQKHEKVYTYAVTRSSQTESGKMLTEPGYLFNFKKGHKTPVFVDWQPPVEQQVIYQIYSVDVFGRRSEPVTSKLFVADDNALRPPAELTAKASPGKVKLKWKQITNKHTRGIFIARAYLHQGPYEFLQRKPLSVTATSFVDTSVKGGTDYYYRVYAMNPRGDLGPPSDPVAAQPRALKPPLTPGNLRAQTGMSRVRLVWQTVPCAGYIVERRDPAGKRWSRLNERITPEPRFDDHVGSGNGGEFEYRVIAVAQDNQHSEASDIVKVHLHDSLPPPAPSIISALSDKGQVALRFRPGEPAQDSRQFLVLRAGNADEPGLVLGDPLSASARDYADAWVESGQTYWYRIVAVDATGNRSQPSEAVRVYIANPDIPVAAKPTAKYSKQPVREVKLTFHAPPQGLRALVQASLDGLHWRTVYGPASGNTAIDSSPPKHGSVRYRVRYQAGNGVLGKASPETTLALPRAR